MLAKVLENRTEQCLFTSVPSRLQETVKELPEMRLPFVESDSCRSDGKQLTGADLSCTGRHRVDGEPETRGDIRQAR